jgi:hypothetical protein
MPTRIVGTTTQVICLTMMAILVFDQYTLVHSYTEAHISADFRTNEA